MRGFLSKIRRKNSVIRRFGSMALALLMVLSTLQILPAGILVANAASDSTNITVHFYNQYSWAEPAMQYWGGSASTVTGNSAEGEIEGWGGVTGYSLTDDGDNWYSISINGDFTGVQFLDMQNPDSNTGGGIANAYVLACKGDTATDLYVKHNGTWKWYTDAAFTTELTSSEPVTNITVNLGIPTSWGWTTPTLQYWDCATVELSGYGAEEDIPNWGVKGYTLTGAGTESDIAWYTINLKGTLTGIGTQFLDLANTGSNTGGSIFVNELLGDEYKKDTPTNVYVSYVNNAWTWYKDKAFTTPVIPEPETNITVNLGIPTSWGWTTPTMQYWGSDTAVLSGYEAKETITEWSVDGYTLTDAGTESDIAWYTITLSGNLNGIGTQFLDLDNPSGSNTGGSIFINELHGKDFKSKTPINVYVSYVDGAWTWYKDKALTNSIVAPSTLEEQTVTVHFDNSEEWEDVVAYIGMTSSFKPITHESKTVYAYANSWPGAVVEANPDNDGWYSFKVTTDPGEIALIFNNNGKGTQTENIYITPDEEETEVWITLTSDNGNRTVAKATTEPEGWIASGTEINPPVNPLAGATYDSPVVNDDGSVTFNLEKGEITSAEVMGTLPGGSWTVGYGFKMEEEGDIFTYTTEAGVAPGAYEYKFVTNPGEKWGTDPMCDLSANGNSVVVVPGLANGEVAPQKGVETDLPSALKLYTAGSVNATNAEVTYTLDKAELADVVTIDNINHKITVSTECTATEFTLTAMEAGGKTSKVYVKPQDKVYTYTIYYYDSNEAHRAIDAAQIWAWANDGASISDANDFSSKETLTDGNEWLKAVIKTPSTDIGFKSRSYGSWEWESTNYGYKNTEKAENVTLYFVFGDAQTYTAIPEIEEARDRYILVSYKRTDNNYENETSGWNFYSWNTGLGAETEIYTELMNGEYIMKAPIRDSEEDFTLAFIIRNSEKASTGNKWVDKDGGDTYVTIPGDQEVVKVYFEQGKAIVGTLPYNKSYDINGMTDTITFYYRDDAVLASTNSAQINETVKVVVDGTEYIMTYDAENERYYYALANCEDGEYEFYYKVGTKEIEDKFASNGVVTYKSFDDLSISATLSQTSMDYNDNNVLTVAFAGADAGNITKEEVASITADLSALGLTSKFVIAPELMEGTISVDRSIAAGAKTIDVTLTDVYGNTYTTSVNITVTERDADAFDWDEAVIYMTCTDRFFDGSTSNNAGVDKTDTLGYHGGDFAGLTAKLDYLKELGVNTIWITPIVQNSNTDSDNGYHGYWASDFTSLSTYLGTEDEFRTLLTQAHARDMKIMVDVVLNHAGYNTEDYFNDILDDGATDVTMIRDAANTIVGDDVYSSLSGLPDFMTEDPAVRDQLVEWQVNWMDKFDIDYYRVDTVKHVDGLTWQAFKNELTKVNPDFKMIGEYYGAGYASTGGALGTGTMDSLLDFDINDKARDFVTGSISSVEAFYVSRNTSISNSATLGGFLSSHDEDSFVDILINEKNKTEEEALNLAKVAAALQITAKGQVVIYYGEEIGQHGLNNWPTQSNRNDFDWTEAEEQQGEEGSMLTHYQTLLGIRNEYSDVFATGTRTTISANDSAGYDVFKRATADEELFVALNIKSSAQTVSFATGTADGTIYTDLYGGGTYKVASGKVTVSVPAVADGGTVVLVKTGYEQPTTPSTPATPNTGNTTPSSPSEEKTTTTTQPGPTTDSEEEKTEEKVEVKTETNAETKVPEKVTEVTPVVDEDLQEAIEKEAEKIIENILKDEVSEDAISERTVENVKKAQENGEGIITEVIIDKLDESKVDTVVKEALGKALAELVKDTQGAETKIAQYLDLTVLLKTASGQKLGTINKLSKEMTFTIAVPDELVKEGRIFVILRMHEGETTVLETIKNSDGTLSFKTDRFSTYALAYVDVPTEDAEEGSEGDIPSGSIVTEEDEGNNFTVFIVVGLIIVIITALVIILLAMKGKKKE